MPYVVGGSKCNLVTGYTIGADVDQPYGRHEWLAQTFTITSTHILFRCRFLGYTTTPAELYEYAIRAVDGSGKPTGPDLVNTQIYNQWESPLPIPKWQRFDFDTFTQFPAGQYALIARLPTAGSPNTHFIRADQTAPTYTLGKAWRSLNDGVTWSEIAGTDLMFEVWGWQPPPPAKPPPVISNWAPITYKKGLTQGTFQIQVKTDIAVHLFLRWTEIEPLTHPVELFRRGISLPYATYWCFVAWEENEQLEPGDTLTHTFIKPDWPVCKDTWLYFIGTKQCEESPSASPIFKLHRTAQEVEAMIMIAKQTLTSPGLIDMSGLDTSAYPILYLFFSGRGTTTLGEVYLRLNGYTQAYYYTERVYANAQGVSQSEFRSDTQFRLGLLGAQSGIYKIASRVIIFNHNDIEKEMEAQTGCVGDQQNALFTNVATGRMTSVTVERVTRIQITNNVAANFAAGAQAILYGLLDP